MPQTEPEKDFQALIDEMRDHRNLNDPVPHLGAAVTVKCVREVQASVGELARAIDNASAVNARLASTAACLNWALAAATFVGAVATVFLAIAAFRR